MVMRRLPLLDAVLLAVLVPLWLAALGLHLRQMTGDRLAWVAVYLRAPLAPHDHPTVWRPWRGHENETTLARGDALLTLGGRDLSGLGPFGVFAIAHEERARAIERGETSYEVPVTYRRGLQESNASLPFVPVAYPWRMLPLTVSTMAAGVLVMLRRPGVRVARAFFLCATAFCMHWTFFFGGNQRITYAWIVAFLVASTLMFPLILRAAWMVPERSTEKREPRWFWLFALTGPVVTTAFLGAPMPPSLGFSGLFAVNVAFITALLALLTHNYTRADALGRRQLKWVLYGLYAGLAPVLAVDLVTLAYPGWWWLHDLATMAEVLIPLCIFIAVVRFKLYDIDSLITTTVGYSLLSVAFLAALVGLVPPFAEAASGLMGIDRRVGTSALSALAAISVVLLGRSLNPFVERLLFRERFAVQEGVRELLAEIPRFDARGPLLEFVRSRLLALLRPVSCIVYELSGAVYAPVIQHAMQHERRAVALTASGRLIQALSRARAPLDFEEWRDQGETTALDTDERIALETLAPGLLVPVHVGQVLRCFVLLGAKRSGDVYSPSDRALLGAVADKVAERLARLEEARRTAAGPLLLPPKYEMVAEVGRGGMGWVYKVRHVRLRKVVALKILPPHLARDPELVSRFHREARIMASLRHPNIVPVLDVDEEGGLHYFVMEYIAGRSLAQFLRRDGRLAPRRVLELGAQIGSALAYAHAHDPPVIHRDIKPANVLIDDRTGAAIVTDFGIAKVAGMRNTLRTRVGAFIGTLEYASPEQVRGDQAIDGRADIYALGMLMFEALAGRHLLTGLEEHEILRCVLQGEGEHDIPLDAAIPATFRRIIARAIARNPEARYPCAEALVDDISRVAEDLSGSPLEIPESVHDADAAHADPSASPRALSDGSPGFMRGDDGDRAVAEQPDVHGKPTRRTTVERSRKH